MYHMVSVPLMKIELGLNHVQLQKVTIQLSLTNMQLGSILLLDIKINTFIKSVMIHPEIIREYLKLIGI